MATLIVKEAIDQSMGIFMEVAIYSHCCGVNGKTDQVKVHCLFGMLRNQMTRRFEDMTFLVKNLEIRPSAIRVKLIVMILGLKVKLRLGNQTHTARVKVQSATNLKQVRSVEQFVLKF